MGFDVAGAFLSAIVLAAVLRGERGGGFTAFVAGLLGFFLAGTGLGAPIGHALHSIVTALGNTVH